MPGVGRIDLLRIPTQPRERILFMNRPPTLALIAHPWKFAWEDRLAQTKAKLYNVDTDPDELAPIDADSDPELFQRLKTELISAAESQSASWGPLPGTAEAGLTGSEADLEALRAVGYLGDG